MEKLKIEEKQYPVYKAVFDKINELVEAVNRIENFLKGKDTLND